MLEARRTLIALAVGVAASTTSPWLTAAEPFLDQPPNGGNGAFADLSCGACGNLSYVVADSWALSQAATLRRIGIWGGHFDDLPFADSFTIWVYPDADGLPGSLAAYHEAAVIPVRAVATGGAFGGTTEIAYTLLLTSPPVLAAGSWWVVVANDSTDYCADFLWESGTVDPQHGAAGSAYRINSSTWYASAGDYALLLDADLFSDGFEAGGTAAWSSAVP